jgi:hypothetical protein
MSRADTAYHDPLWRQIEKEKTQMRHQAPDSADLQMAWQWLELHRPDVIAQIQRKARTERRRVRRQIAACVREIDAKRRARARTRA